LTICIASMAGDDHVVVTSDRMITLSLPSTEFEQNVPKTIKLTDNCVAATAGNALGFVPIYEETLRTIKQSKNALGIQEISEIIKTAYTNARNAKLEQDVLSTMGLNLQSFYQLNKSLASEIVANLATAMKQYTYGVSILIAGVDESGGHIYRIDNPGRVESYDTIGHCAIGSGDLHAVSTFIGNDYDPNLDVDHVVAMTYEAKRKSEKAQGVGEETDLYVVCNNGIIQLPEDKVKQLAEIFDKKTDQEKESVVKLEVLVKKLDIKSLDENNVERL